MQFENIEKLLQGYCRDLANSVGCQIESDPEITTDLVLMAVEEMLGIGCGGHIVGEALEKWLSQPDELRQQINFEEMKSQFNSFNNGADCTL